MTTTYTSTPESTIQLFDFDARELASGSYAILDYVGAVKRIEPASPEIEDFLDYLSQRELCCNVCDGLGHAYIVGWETFTNGDSRPVIGGKACPIDGLGLSDPRDY